MAPLSWRHHTLLQALLSCGPLPEPDFHSLFAQISGGKNPATHQELFNDILLKINKELAYLQFELRACINQYDGMVYYGVVNNIADEESKLGSKYPVPQIAFYKGLLEAIAHEAGNDGSITNIEALNIRIDNQLTAARPEAYIPRPGGRRQARSSTALSTRTPLARQQPASPSSLRPFA